MYEGEKVILRAFEKEDIKKFHKAFNNYELQKLLNPRTILPITYEEEEKMINEFSQDKDKKFIFSIVTKKDKKLIGSCSCEQMDHKNRTAIGGIAIMNKKDWGKGYGSDAIKVFLNIMFNEVNMRKLTYYTYSYNERALECYKKIGFKEEGRLKEHIYREGKYHDVIFMSFFKKDFKYYQSQ